MLTSYLDLLTRANPPLLLAVGPEHTVRLALADLSAVCGAPVLPLSRQLAERLADLSPRDRARRAMPIVYELVGTSHGALTILDRTAILFLPQLMLNPLQVLTRLSQNSGPLVAAWCGAWDGANLTYAHPGHPEYQHYTHLDALVAPVA